MAQGERAGVAGAIAPLSRLRILVCGNAYDGRSKLW